MRKRLKRLQKLKDNALMQPSLSPRSFPNTFVSGATDGVDSQHSRTPRTRTKQQSTSTPNEKPK
jgi:hypothetical protein